MDEQSIENITDESVESIADDVSEQSAGPDGPGQETAINKLRMLPNTLPNTFVNAVVAPS